MEPIARWKDLCLDAEDPLRLGTFWAAVLGMELDASRTPPSLVGAAEHERIWVNPVERPRPDSPKQNRVHLDVYAVSVADLEALGARVLARAEDTGLGWTTMTDPEGGELCCFVRAEPPRRRLHGIGVDCVDPERLATWWGTVLGREVTAPPDESWWTVEHATPDDVLTLDFDAVPEPKVGPNRIHWDVEGDVDALVAAGASRLWETEGWVVLGDPEGHEFCCFPPA